MIARLRYKVRSCSIVSYSLNLPIFHGIIKFKTLYSNGLLGCFDLELWFSSDQRGWNDTG